MQFVEYLAFCNGKEKHFRASGINILVSITFRRTQIQYLISAFKYSNDYKNAFRHFLEHLAFYLTFINLEIKPNQIKDLNIKASTKRGCLVQVKSDTALLLPGAPSLGMYEVTTTQPGHSGYHQQCPLLINGSCNASDLA